MSDAFTEQIRHFVVETFLFGDGGALQNSDSLRQRGIVDSTGVLDLLGFLEERYNLTVSDAELTPENFDSIDRISAFVRQRRGEAAGT